MIQTTFDQSDESKNKDKVKDKDKPKDKDKDHFDPTKLAPSVKDY